MKLKSDLKHTASARAQVEGREDEARNSLRAAEGTKQLESGRRRASGGSG